MKMNKRRLLTGSLLVTNILLASSLAFTFAAYVNNETHNQVINVDLSYSKYFSSGVGSAESPYLISNSNELRNLSRLTMLGCFNETDYFALANDITFEGDPLIPIGTDDTPFLGHFDGQGYKITDLVVQGYDLADVGMFGYVANGASIANFLLINPTINSFARETLTFTKENFYSQIDSNPIRKIISHAEASSITCSLSDDSTEYIKSGSFTFDLSGLPETNGLTYKVRTSNSSILTASISGTTATATINGSYNDEGSYVVFEIYTDGIINVANEGEDPQFKYVRFVVERYKFYYSQGQGICNKAEEVKYWKKMICAENESTEDNSGVTTYTNNSHVLYVGIVAGHLDGTAEYIGVYTPTLNVKSRPFKSYSYLFGRKIDDDENSTLSKHNIGPDSYNSASRFTYSEIDQYMQIKNDNNNITNTDRGIGNSYINEIYGTASGYQVGSEYKDTVKLFATNYTLDSSVGTNRTNTTFFNNQGVVLSNGKTYIDELNDEKTNKFISFKKDMDGRVKEKTTGLIVTGNKNMYASNAFQFWCLTNDTNSTLYKLFNGKAFYISFDFDYLLYVNNSVGFTNNYSNIRLNVFGTKKQAQENGNYLFKTSYYDAPGTDEYMNAVDNQTYPERSRYNDATLVKTDANGNAIEPFKFTSENIAGEVSDFSNSSKPKIQHKTVTLEYRSNASWSAAFTDRTPLFLFGVDSSYQTSSVDGNGNTVYENHNYNGQYLFNILNMSVTISDTNGNIASTTKTVDYMFNQNATYNTATKEWSNWNRYSNVVVSTSSIVTSSEDEAIPVFYNASDSMFICSATRAATGNGAVTINYTLNGTNVIATPQNKEGFATANINGN